tara:strand:+ start:2297 stop:2932 length:636 start_codon:yes stop_codon:yes gene_type:complete
MTKSKQTTFEKLSAINVNSKVEKKNNLTYLSWAWAWSEVKKACPDATYQMGETTYDEALGFMCNSSVTIEGETLAMWLPVMNGSNKAMKKVSYIHKTTYKEIEIQAATSFDINKTMMRCLVKNLAMFGLGIYIYAGEDMPESDEPAMVTTPEPPKRRKPLKENDKNWKVIMAWCEENKKLGAMPLLTKVQDRGYIVSAVVKSAINAIVDAK